MVIDGFKLSDVKMNETDHSATARFAYGISLNNSPNCTIKNCDISLVGAGIEIYGSSNNCHVTNNYMHNLRMIVNTVGGDDDYGANPLIISSSNNAIMHNRFEECWALSYDYGYDGGAIEFYGKAINNNTIMYNTAINCNGFLEIGSGSGGSVSNNIVAYNKIINCGVIGTLHTTSNFGVAISNLQYYNNNVIETKQQFTIPGFLFDVVGNPQSGMLVVKNNIFWTSNNTTIYETAFSGVTNHSNNLYRMTNGSIGIALGSNEIKTTTANIFSSTSGDPADWNFALPPGGMAINFGIDVGYKTDFVSNPIIDNPDAGIMEFLYPASNQLPVANAGNDINLTLPINATIIDGSGTDADGIIRAYLWTRVSGPTTFTLANANAASTNITNLVQGTYVFRLTVSDNDGATGSDDITVTVHPAPIVNNPPTANAGNDVVLVLPANATTLTGTGSDADGTITKYLWTRLSGPTTFTLANANAASTNITNLVQGTYVFRLTVYR